MPAIIGPITFSAVLVRSIPWEECGTAAQVVMHSAARANESSQLRWNSLSDDAASSMIIPTSFSASPVAIVCLCGEGDFERDLRCLGVVAGDLVRGAMI
jgi:hypothetical protein